MKEQYVGDINDYRKYALLRALSCEGQNKIGICWMLTPPDDRSDGSKRRYLDQPHQYQRFDPELFDLLARVAGEPDQRRLRSIEEGGAVPGADYFNAPLSDDKVNRTAFMKTCMNHFAAKDLIFFDPDNGLEVSLPKGRKNSSKYVYLDEIGTAYATGKSVLVYQHFPRIKREAFVAACASRLRGVAPDALIWSFRTPDVVFLLLVNPVTGQLFTSAAQAAASRWTADFIAGATLK